MWLRINRFSGFPVPRHFRGRGKESAGSHTYDLLVSRNSLTHCNCHQSVCVNRVCIVFMWIPCSFVTVIFYQYPIFTRNRVVIIAFIQIVASIGLAVMTQFIFPCCRFAFIVWRGYQEAVSRLSLTYTVYTYTYLEIPGVPNYTNMFDLPLNSVASITPLFAYSAVCQESRRLNHKLNFR